MEIITTEDGSNSIYLPEIDETYHSSHGAIQESQHIFINLGLFETTKSKIKILEVGFGTGLNAYLTAIQSSNHIEYTTFELFPLKFETIKTLNYDLRLKASKELFLNLHQASWGNTCSINSKFELLKMQADFSKYNLNNLTNLNPDGVGDEELFDLVYFDAFSPEKQPELWTLEIFSKIYNQCSDGAILTTYCAKGQVRRNLQNAGFKVERLPGPPGKREVLRARKI